MRILLTLIFVSIGASAFAATDVSCEDGESIQLRADGTSFCLDAQLAAFAGGSVSTKKEDIQNCHGLAESNDLSKDTKHLEQTLSSLICLQMARNSKMTPTAAGCAMAVLRTKLLKDSHYVPMTTKDGQTKCVMAVNAADVLQAVSAGKN